MSAAPKLHLTVDEYFELERSSEDKWEYYYGHVVRVNELPSGMAGGQPAHNITTVNLGAELRTALLDRPCTVFSSDQRVLTADGPYVYPDVSVACEEPDFRTVQGLDTLTNPVALFEVLSESTERRDRTEKFYACGSIPSLALYVLVSTARPVVECFERLDDGGWRLTYARGLDASLHLPVLDVPLDLARVYHRVSFTPPEPREGAAA